MRRLAVACLLFSVQLILAQGSAHATDNSPGPQLGGRVGYVDFNRALNNVSDGRRARARLEAEFREKQQQLDRLQSELKGVRDAIERDRLLLSPEALREREEQYRQKYFELNQKLDAFKRDVAEKESEMTREILGRLRSIVRDIGREGDYAVILEKSQDVVLYVPEGGDLTERVISEYDRGRGVKKKK